ncbi:MAG: hypothetical protein GFH27_549283n375 [Chloroflexi bacterium AL-W]|nr:hypothetical protein [Chloroflexi bacterium AL-N1]NOK64503.1 hypothetical protein [Chloroflexi bacterium AL-N10]NOK75745.1 hypothetical protein [Chloroflexi bacterium AL-N5]NOK80496.1 hypothetical protein [Chloroflexi bacterium AL-W]NOK87010.1 hypothetical protein [Chloroflexi bacterium AL-N15]
MTAVQWDMSDQSIVHKADEPRVQDPFVSSPFQKPKPHEKTRFDVFVVAEPMDKGPLLKKGNVSTNLPGWANWDIICDTGTTGGGFNPAPSPLMYFSA